MTALAIVDDRRKVLNGGFAGYISNPIQPETCIDQLTSSVWPERDRDQAMKLGADQFFVRPISPDCLLEEIKAVLDRTCRR